MSRRSTRLQGIAKGIIEDTEISNTSDEEFRVEGEEEPEFLPKKKAKRRKVDKSTAAPVAEDQKIKRVRGRRGILSSLREFPLDVVAEIFGHLNPIDLINLSRTTKEIRGILMARSSTFIWKESRSHVEGLPDLPPGLSEPQYANLCFSGHCHKCLAMPVTTIIWSVWTRLCKKCIKADFVHFTELEIDYSLLSLVPTYDEPRHGRSRYGGTRLYSIDTATRLKEESAPFKKDGTLQNQDAKYKEWHQQKSDQLKEIIAHASLCATWATNRTTDRKDELADARKLRHDAIVERLTALGWGEEIPFHPYDFKFHKLVKQPKELTERIWSNIETPLVEFLTELKKTRLAAARVKIIKERRVLASRVYSAFCESLSPDSFYPPRIDVLLTEPFRAIVEDTPVEPEEKVTEETFATALLTVPEFSSDWRRRKDEELAEIMKKKNPNSVEADLLLATTFFTCFTDSAAEPVSYPRILVHSKATAFRYGTWDWNSLQGTFSEEAWNAGGEVKFDERAERHARFVVEACGLDPGVTTRTEMDEINPALECLNCNNEHGRLLMRWMQAVHHKCDSTTIPSWKCLNVDEERLLEAKEKQTFEALASSPFSLSYHSIYCCKMCGNSKKMNFDKLKGHLGTEHNIDSITFKDFEYHLDVPPSHRLRPIRLQPPVEAVEVKEGEEQALEEVVPKGDGTV